MTNINAALATLHGSGFTRGIGEIREGQDTQLVVGFNAGDVYANTVSLFGFTRASVGSRLFSAVPILKAGTHLAAFAAGDPDGVGVLDMRSNHLRFDELEPVAGLEDQADGAPIFWAGGEGVGIPTLQIRNGEAKRQVFVFRDGQSIVVADLQRRMGLIRFVGETFFLRQLTQEDVFKHVVGRALTCTTLREARWCKSLLAAIGMSNRDSIVAAKIMYLRNAPGYDK